MLRERLIAVCLLSLCFSLAAAVRPAAARQDASAEQILSEAHVSLRQQHYAEAIRLLQDALERFPKDHRLRFELGRAYLYSRQDGRALESFQAVLQADPSHHGAKLELARLRGYRREYETSNALYRELLATDASDEAASIGLVRNLIKQGNTREALREVDKALAHHPNSLRLQEYKDVLDKRRSQAPAPEHENFPSTAQAEAAYFSDTSGNRSWRAAQNLDYQLSRTLRNSVRVEERSLWFLQGPKVNILSATDELRVRLTPWVYLGGGLGLLRFANGSNAPLFRADLTVHPRKTVWLQGGFARRSIAPTFQAAQYNLLAEGWFARLDVHPRNWYLTANFMKEHYSDSNRAQHLSAEALRWIGTRHFAVGLGYRYSRASFTQQLFHGYFSPGKYQSHLGLGGFRIGIGNIYRAEYVARYGAESVLQESYQGAWEATARNRLLLGKWELGADYSYYHFAQSTGAFRAQTGRALLAYHF